MTETSPQLSKFEKILFYPVAIISTLLTFEYWLDWQPNIAFLSVATTVCVFILWVAPWIIQKRLRTVRTALWLLALELAWYAFWIFGMMLKAPYFN